MKKQLTKPTTFGFTIALVLAGLLAVPLAGAGWVMAEKETSALYDGEHDWTLVSNEETQEEEVDWTLAQTEAEEDETDWTLAKQEGDQEEEVDWTLAKTDAEDDEEDWTLA